MAASTLREASTARILSDRTVRVSVDSAQLKTSILKVRRVSGVETLSLRHVELGSFAVPREWTDWVSRFSVDAHRTEVHSDHWFEYVDIRL
jgi:hypothetical protein